MEKLNERGRYGERKEIKRKREKGRQKILEGGVAEKKRKDLYSFVGRVISARKF